jgi:BACON domain-containing protein/all-beta uncharacterized protein
MRQLCGLFLSSSVAAALAACGGSPTSPNTPACTFRVTLQNPSFAPAGGPGSAAVSAASGCAWTAVSNADWIKLGSPASGSGDGSVSFTVASFDGAVDRSGAIVVAKETLTIAQQACAIQISPAEQTFSDASAIRDIDIQAQASCRWQFDAPPSWITLTPASGEGPARVSLRIDNNGTTSPREATLHAGSATLTVRQSAGSGPQPPPPSPQCTFGVNQTHFFPHSDGGTAGFTVTTQPGCSWTASTSAAWIHLNAGGAIGTGSIVMTFDKNPQGYVTDFREGIVEVRWPTPTAGQNVQVSQFGDCATVFVARDTQKPTDTLSFGADGGKVGLDVLTESPFRCPWVVESQPNPQPSPFEVTFPPIQSVWSGDGAIVIAAQPNTSSQSRTATVVAGERTLTIVQAGR